MRVDLIVLLGLKNGLSRSVVKDPEEYKVYIYPTVLVYLIFLYGYIDGKVFYNYYGMPLLALCQLIFGSLFAKSFVRQHKKTEHPLSLVSSKDINEDVSIKFPVTNLVTKNQELLIFHNPFQGIYVQGGAGTGKTASAFEPIHYQFITKGFSGLIYDFKGSELPLTKGVYNTLINKADYIRKLGYKVPKFEFFSIQHPFQSTCKINPLSAKYITSDAHAKAAATALYRNLDKSTIKKSDFWSNNGLAYTRGCIWMLAKNYPQYSTLPHLISVMLNPIVDVISWIQIDDEIGPRLGSIVAAKENEAGAQLSGIESSAQIPFSDLYNEEVFWSLVPDDESEELDLNLNNADDPKMLCIANFESLRDMNGPILGIIINMVINVIRDQPEDANLYKFLLSVDESPTVYLDKIETVPAEMRSKRVCTLLGAQTKSQYDKDYGKEITEVVMDNLSNQLYGGMNNVAHAKSISDMFGEYDKVSESISNSDSGESVSESTKKEKTLPHTNIMGQTIGQFSGKVSDGEPPFFHCQLPDGRTHINLGIEKSEMKKIPFINFPVEDNFDDPKMKMTFQTSIWKELKHEKFQRIVGEANSLIDPYRLSNQETETEEQQDEFNQY